MKFRKRICTTILTLAMAACAMLTLSGAALAAESGAPAGAEELFTERDLEQTADLTAAKTVTVADGKDVTITEAGVYVLSGEAENTTVIVEAGDDDKVQLVLDGVKITNEDFPCIYVKNADKVFITVSGDSELSVAGAFRADGETNTDGVIFSRSDLVMNGEAALSITSTDNGVVCKDDLKLTGGTYTVTAASKAFEANDSIRVAGGTYVISAGTDGLHAENSDDDTLGYIYIVGGYITVKAGDDAVHALSYVSIDDGSLAIAAAEGIEASYIRINGGTIDIQASDDGINAAYKSSAYYPAIEINGGEITVVMASGDTDGIDSNGNITINGGVINVTGGSTFDCDGAATYNGGTIIVNGQQVNYIPSQMGGFGGRGRRW